MLAARKLATRPTPSAAPGRRPYATSSTVFESFASVPTAWHELCGKDDLAMDPKVLHVFARTLADQCRSSGVIVFDAAGKAIGCAALCGFATEMVETSHPALLRWRNRIRRIWPGFGQIKVLFCGLPVPSGGSHLRVKAGVDTKIVAVEVSRVMQRVASEWGSTLMVFKELGYADTPLEKALSALEYTRGAIPPLHVLEGHFKNFDAYCAALKNRYRAQIRRSQKKLESAGFEVECGRGSAFCAAHFDEAVYALYLAVHSRARQKLECLPVAFFPALAAELGDDEALLTLIRKNGHVCAFTFSVTRGNVHYNLYSGLDYALNNAGDLYFNLFYQDLDQAFRAGATSVHLGQTSDDFKGRLGTSPEKRFFFARARSTHFKFCAAYIRAGNISESGLRPVTRRLCRKCITHRNICVTFLYNLLHHGSPYCFPSAS